MAKNEERETFREALRDVRREERFTQAEMAHVVGVSPKTLARWENEEGHPGNGAHGVVAAIGARFPKHRDRIALSLGVPVVAVPPPPAPNMALLAAALDGAVYEATEKLGVPAAKVREAMASMLERVALTGLDAKTAAKMVAGKG